MTRHRLLLLIPASSSVTDDPIYYFRLVSMSTCSMHSLSSGDLDIKENAPPGSMRNPTIKFEVCGDHFAVLLSWKSDEGDKWELFRWNWHTGVCLVFRYHVPLSFSLSSIFLKAVIPDGLFRHFALQSYVRQDYQDVAFLTKEFVAAGALIADKDGRNAWAAVDILEIAHDKPLQQVRLLLPEISDGYSATKITLQHRPPIGDSKFYPNQPPFQVSEGDSVLLIELELTGETVDGISIMVPVRNLLAYRSPGRTDPASRNIPWDTWGPQNTCVCNKKAEHPWHISGARACRKSGDSLLFFEFSRSSRSPEFVSSLGGDPIKDNYIYYREPRAFSARGFRDKVVSSLPCRGFELHLNDDSEDLKLRGLTEYCIMLSDDVRDVFDSGGSSVS